MGFPPNSGPGPWYRFANGFADTGLLVHIGKDKGIAVIAFAHQHTTGFSPTAHGFPVFEAIALGCKVQITFAAQEGLEVVMIGHSEIVGKPAAMMLMAEGCTVTVCHHMTRSVAMHSRRADVVVVAVGKAHLVGPDMIKPGAAVIDIGINQIETDDGPKIVGDVDTDAVLNVAGWITPVPGGVGPVTVAILMRNAMVAHQRQIAAGWL